MANTPKSQERKPNSNDLPQRRLLRSANERWLAGVAGGTAKYLGTDPTFVRLGFAVATFFGGFGILAYLVMAVIVPVDDGTGEPVEGRPPAWALVLLGLVALIVLPGSFIGDGGWFFGIGFLWLVALLIAGALAYRAMRGDRPAKPAADTAAGATAETEELASSGMAQGTAPRLVRLLAIGLVGFVALGAAVSVAALGAFATATGSGAIVAGVVIALGLGLAAVALIGDEGSSAKRWAPWVLAVALVLAVPSGAVAAADVRFDGGVGERTYSASTADGIAEDGYELGVGQMKIDLRELEVAPGETVDVPAELGIGQLVIAVPSGVCVTGEADAKGGELVVRGESSDGINPEFRRASPVPAEPGAKTPPEVQIDAELQFGQLVVTDRDPDDFEGGKDDKGPFGDDGGRPDEIAAEPEACEG